MLSCSTGLLPDIFIMNLKALASRRFIDRLTDLVLFGVFTSVTSLVWALCLVLPNAA